MPSVPAIRPYPGLLHRASPKCVKFTESRHSVDCKKTRDVPAKCVNCNGLHPASYRGCSKYAAAAKKPAPAPTKTATRPQPAANRQTGKSFAEAAKAGRAASGAPKQKPAAREAVAPPPAIMDFTAMMQQMQQMYAAMSTFFAQLPPMTVNKNN